MENEKYKGKIYSFYELLTLSNIEIPIIQRDYAQGRKDQKKIRNNFLNALYESLVNNQQIMLDFIYGSNIDSSFQPLDGQQRLTTLFLLHWYASIKSSKLSEVSGVLKKFTYETRISSRDFCNALTSNKITINEFTKLSETIIDSPWFFLSWKNDPTIDAMLRTIDDINDKFSEVPDLLDLLISSEKKLIRFYHVELENIGLTDDLYIKMNARGKLLTPFENFKASFEKLIRDNKWENNEDFRESFAFKIDTTWTDLFWKNFRVNNNIDTSFISFISTVVMIRKSVKRLVKTDERTKIISELQDEPNNVNPKLFDKTDFNILIDYFKTLNEKYDKIKSINISFPLFRHTPKESFLKEVLLNPYGASYTQKILLFAQLEYFRKTETIDEDKYLEWIRVVRNIVSRGDIEKTGRRLDIVRSPQTFDGMIYLISELSSGCHDIYNHLSNTKSLKSTFAKDQIEEERTKAKLILDNINLKPVIHELEDTDLFRGRLSFALFCLDFNQESKSLTFDKINNFKKIFIENFNSESKLTNNLRRALLTVEVDGKYEFYNYWWSSWSVEDCDKRRLLDNFREIEYLIFSEYKSYMKKLISMLETKKMIEIPEDFSAPEGFPKWKLRLIKEKNLLDDNKSNYIAIPKNNNLCYLLKSKRPRDREGSIEIS